MAATRRSFLATMATCAAALTSSKATAHAATGTAKKNWSMPKKNSLRVIENEWIVMKDGVRLGARLSSTPEEFRIKESVIAWDHEERVFQKAWDQKIPRDLL
jgi:hypothetical protein